MDLMQFIFKRLKPTFVAAQAKKPTGFFGKQIMTRLFDHGNRGLNDFIFSTSNPLPGEFILEIGFGSGQLLKKIIQINPDGYVAGVDFSADMIDRSQLHLKKWLRPGHAEVMQAEISLLPFADEMFDKVVTANTLYFWPKPQHDIQQIYRVLKPEGMVAIGFRTKEQMQKLPLTQHGFTTYTTAAVEQLLKQAGFEKIKIHFRKEPLGFDSYCAVGFK